MGHDRKAESTTPPFRCNSGSEKDGARAGRRPNVHVIGDGHHRFLFASEPQCWQGVLMPVLVIAVSCLVIFGIIGILGVAAVHFERKQQVREEHLQSSTPEGTKAAKAV